MVQEQDQEQEQGCDLQLRVEQHEHRTVVTARLDKPADYCYRMFSRPEDIPRWLWVVGNAVVQRRDHLGRALDVDFMGKLERASIAYSLTYAYDDDELKVSWHHRGGAVKALAGTACFTPETEQTCRVRYVLQSEISKSLPPWSDGLYETRPAEAVVLDFCEWLDNSWNEDH